MSVSIEFKITTILRTQAIMATFFGFLAATNRVYVALETGLHCIADIIAIYNTVRT